MDKSRNKTSLEQIVDDFRPKLDRLIRRWVPNREDAEDVLQDVLYQLVKTLGNGSDPIGHVSAWIYRVARNTIINMGRKKHEEPLPVFMTDDDEYIWEEFSETLFNDDNPTPETAYLRSLVWNELDMALGELPPEQREVFMLTEFDGVPVKDISKATGIPQATLLSRKHYAVKHLRRRLKELYTDIINVEG